MKQTARYKKGFRDGFNNPNQYINIDLNKVPEDDLIKGIISGVIERRKDILNGINNNFIWNDKELNERVV